MKRRAFTLVEIMIVVAIIGLLAAIAIPSFIKARETSRKNACINNLRQIDGAIQQYIIENNLSEVADVPEYDSDELAEYYKGKVVPSCPGGGTYANPVDPFGEGTDSVPTCTIDGHELPASD
ncbi:MAG: type II secretion system protein [Lentisphaeria bacterium]|jgi:prepilin-type N-terminal cleavage/methylation domain-containing protein